MLQHGEANIPSHASRYRGPVSNTRRSPAPCLLRKVPQLVGTWGPPLRSGPVQNSIFLGKDFVFPLRCCVTCLEERLTFMLEEKLCPQWVWGNHEMNNSGKSIPIKVTNRNSGASQPLPLSPAPRSITVQGAAVSKCGHAVYAPFLLLVVLTAGAQMQGPTWSKREAACLSPSFQWLLRTVQTGCRWSCRTSCDDWPASCLVYSLTLSRHQFLEPLMTHFSTKCK